MKVKLRVAFDSINHSLHNIAAVNPDLTHKYFVDLGISRICTAAILFAKNVIIVEQEDVLILHTFDFEQLYTQVLLILCNSCFSFE